MSYSSEGTPAIVDPKGFIKEKLGAIEGVEIHDASRFNSLPPKQRLTKTTKITVTTLDNHNANIVVDFLSFQFEITAENVEKCENAASEVAKIMNELGFTRSLSSECFWSGQHQSIVQRYTGFVDKRNGLVYSTI